MKDFLFVDAVSGAPLSREEKNNAPLPSNAEIKPGNQFDSWDRADNIARLVGFFIAIVWFRWACAPMVGHFDLLK